MNPSGSGVKGKGVSAQRGLLRPLLAQTDPADAMSAYYALTYDPMRVQLTLSLTLAGQADGFVAVCQTGRDLFVPLVVVRAPQGAVDSLLRRALQPGRPYRVVTKPALQDAVQDTMSLGQQQINLIYVLDPASYRPVINVMVQPGQDPFRFEIRTAGRVVAAAGVNWQASRLAEMYVYTDTSYQNRGWGRAVSAACVKALLEAHLIPLYTASRDNVASQRLARSLGFRDSEAREFECQGQLHP